MISFPWVEKESLKGASNNYQKGNNNYYNELTINIDN